MLQRDLMGNFWSTSASARAVRGRGLRITAWIGLAAVIGGGAACGAVPPRVTPAALGSSSGAPALDHGAGADVLPQRQAPIKVLGDRPGDPSPETPAVRSLRSAPPSASLLACTACAMSGWHQQGELLHGTVAPGSCTPEEIPTSFLLGRAKTASGTPIARARVERGKLAGELPSAKALTGSQWRGARLQARLGCAAGLQALEVEARITDVRPVGGDADTFLYRVEVQDPATSAWYPMCGADKKAMAIPHAGVWDERGDLSGGREAFTFACTTSVAAKCYQWGYRPWEALTPATTGTSDEMRNLFQACTRMARADYCGDGRSATKEGTMVNVWDSAGHVPAGAPREGFVFEAAWGPGGAVCMDHPRWPDLPSTCSTPVPPCHAPPPMGAKAANHVYNASLVNLLPGSLRAPSPRVATSSRLLPDSRL